MLRILARILPVHGSHATASRAVIVTYRLCVVSKAAAQTTTTMMLPLLQNGHRHLERMRRRMDDHGECSFQGQGRSMPRVFNVWCVSARYSGIALDTGVRILHDLTRIRDVIYLDTHMRL